MNFNWNDFGIIIENEINADFISKGLYGSREFNIGVLD